MSWSYHFELVSGIGANPSEWTRKFNEVGKDGWEFVRIERLVVAGRGELQYAIFKKAAG
jgi:hypothetical protein